MAQTIKLKRSATQGAIPATSQLALGEIAINTYDGKLFIKKDGSSESIVEIGGDATSAYSKTTFTATASQTTFAATYTVGFVDVYLNGIKLLLNTDYTANNGTSIVLSSGANTGDNVEIIAFSGTTLLQVAELTLDRFTYTATASQTTFSGADDNTNTLAYTSGNIDVYLNGILLDESEYTATNGTSIVLDSSAALNDIVKIHAYTTSSAGDLTISGALTLGSTQLTATAAELNLLDSVSRGSLIYGDTSGNSASLAVGPANYVLTSDGTDIAWQVSSNAKFVEKTANYTLIAGDKIIVDTSSSALTMTLPASPTLGDEVSIIDGAGNAATNNITISRNGSNIEGTADDLTLDVDAAAFSLVYYNASRGWIFTEK
jgi:hypothetical protein